MSKEVIFLQNVKTHNLKNIDVEIPKNVVCMVLGVSGSGKSSLFLDTLHPESLFRYLETISNGNGIWTKRREKPDVEDATGITPTIVVDPRSSFPVSGARAIEITELLYFLRLLFVSGAQPYCINCRSFLKVRDVQGVVREILTWEQGCKLIVTARCSGASLSVENLLSGGFTRILENGEVKDVEEITEGFNPVKYYHVIVDRLQLRENSASRLSQSVETAFRVSDGVVSVFRDGVSTTFSRNAVCEKCGFQIPSLSPGLFSRFNTGKCDVCHGRGAVSGEGCISCSGMGYSENVSSWKFRNYSLTEILGMTFGEISEIFSEISPSNKVEGQLLSRILHDLNIICDTILLGDIKASEPIVNLSRGEIQLLRLAKVATGGFSGVVYILDEPSTGLTWRERSRVFEIINKLRNQSNTVIVLEHDLEFLKIADYVIETGPGAGVQGGEIIFTGNVADFYKSKTLTSQILRNLSAKKNYSVSGNYPYHFGFSSLKKNEILFQDIEMPCRALITVTGPMSGGKSTLLSIINDLFSEKKSGCQVSYGGEYFTGGVEYITGIQAKANPHSTVASYLGFSSVFRELLAATILSKQRGWKAGRFSSKSKDGRCETCSGRGRITASVGHMSEMTIECPECAGTRFNADILEIKWRGKNINDILGLTLNEAADFFKNHAKIQSSIKPAQETGLGYLECGQETGTLSGGEFQRMVMARELTRKKKRPCLYIIDDATSGLHYKDMDTLGLLFRNMVEKGHTIIIADDSEYMIRYSDMNIDLKR
ncbi:MAG: hypothetical protein JXR95_07815 [Deltaproteobacteria bacterium]|nr:hypothetical protein [Deltaproteobacteria bacterium]